MPVVSGVKRNTNQITTFLTEEDGSLAVSMSEGSSTVNVNPTPIFPSADASGIVTLADDAVASQTNVILGGKIWGSTVLSVVALPEPKSGLAVTISEAAKTTGGVIAVKPSWADMRLLVAINADFASEQIELEVFRFDGNNLLIQQMARITMKAFSGPSFTSVPWNNTQPVDRWYYVSEATAINRSGLGQVIVSTVGPNPDNLPVEINIATGESVYYGFNVISAGPDVKFVFIGIAPEGN